MLPGFAGNQSHAFHAWLFTPDLGGTILFFKPYKYVANVNRKIKEPYIGEYAKSFLTTALPKETPFDWQVYHRLPDEAEVRNRKKRFYDPFHNKLRELIDDKLNKFGRLFLLDIHSCIGAIHTDICLANGRYASASKKLTNFMEAKLIENGFTTAINDPFSSGYIIRQYGEIPGVEALLLEIWAHTYMPPYELDQGRPAVYNDSFSRQTKNRFHEVIASVSDYYINQHN